MLSSIASVGDCSAPHNGSITTAGDCTDEATKAVRMFNLPTVDWDSTITLRSDPTFCLDFVCDNTPCFKDGVYGPDAAIVKCSGESPLFFPHENKTVTIKAPGKQHDGWCLDMRDHHNPQAYPCVGSQNQKWTLSGGLLQLVGGQCVVGCTVPQPSFPGAAHLHPTIHFTPKHVSMQGGWHDIAGAVTHNSVHHIFMGTGWNHHVSSDLVHWQLGPVT